MFEDLGKYLLLVDDLEASTSIACRRLAAVLQIEKCVA